MYGSQILLDVFCSSSQKILSNQPYKITDCLNLNDNALRQDIPLCNVMNQLILSKASRLLLLTFRDGEENIIGVFSLVCDFPKSINIYSNKLK